MERYLRVLTGLIVLGLSAELRAVVYHDSTGWRDLLGLVAVLCFAGMIVMLVHQDHWWPAGELFAGTFYLSWIFRDHLPPIQSGLAPWALVFIAGALVFWLLQPGGALRRLIESNHHFHHP